MPIRDISSLILQPMAIVSGLWFLLNSALFAFTATVVGLPGRKKQRLVMVISLSAYILLIVVLLGFAFAFKSSINLSGAECIVGVIALSVMPLILFYSIVRKLAPTSPQIMGLLLGLSACRLGAFGLGFSCSDDNPLHLLAPTIIVGTIGAWAGKRVFKW